MGINKTFHSRNIMTNNQTFWKSLRTVAVNLLSFNVGSIRVVCYIQCGLKLKQQRNFKIKNKK